MHIKNKYLPLIIGSCIAIGITIGTALNSTSSTFSFLSTNSKKDKINRLINFIDYEYVDDINTDSIVDVTVNGILNSLDPHSTYISKDDLQRVTENMKGDFIGIGINYYKYKDTLTVIKPTKGGPSERAGIKRGDRILFADGSPLFGENISNEQLTKKLKGEKNSSVKLTVLRKGEEELLDFDVQRGAIPIKSVDAAYMLSDSLGYIKINRFAESTYKEFITALTDLQAKGAKQLALDLRDNPGGFLGVAEQIADEFLEDDKLIVFTRDKKGSEEKTYATSKGVFENGDIYVLINENSASASEVIAGALQDNDKGTIVGRRSYGKGLVQREMELGDGSAVRLTVSRYYTPTGRSIQKPYTKGNKKTYYNDYHKRLRTGEMVDSKQIKVNDSLKFTTPEGKVVYGGGGIIPDVFVPLNSNSKKETTNYLIQRGYVGFFIFEVIDKDRATYIVNSREDFIQNFEVTDALLKQFKNYINQRENSDINFNAYNAELKLLLKATLAQQLFDSAAYEEIINTNDTMIKEVLLLSQNPTSF